MRRAIIAARSILAGVAVAGVLCAVLWQQIGALRCSIYLDPTSRVVHLSYQLMPDLLIIAVGAGIVSGAVGGSGRLRSATLRGATAAIVFAGIAFPAYVFTSSHIPLTDYSLARQSPSVVPLLVGLGLAIVFAAVFGVIGSIPYATTAAASASLGEFLRRRSKRLFAISLCLISGAALVLPIVQGSLLRAELRTLTRSCLAAEPSIRQNLVDLPEACRWRPRGWFSSNVGPMYCDIRDGTVEVAFGANGSVRAEACLTGPKGAALQTRQAALAFLRDHRVRGSVLRNLRQNEWSEWVGRSGDYRVSVFEWSARGD